MIDIFLPIAVVGMLFIGLPWIIFHYTTQWRRAGAISREDEDLLDDLHELDRRLGERMGSIERIIAADNPDWRASSELPRRRRPIEAPAGAFRLHALTRQQEN